MKGFTLVELLGVVIILGILSVVATPTVENIVINSREKAYETQIKDIEKASSDYLLLYPDMAPSDNKVTIYLNTLKKLGLVDKNIKNPKTGKLFSNITSITISKENNMYVYDIKDSDLLDTELNENTPILSIDGEVVDYVEVSQVDKYNIPSCNAANPSGVEGTVNCTYQILNNDTIDITKVGSYQIVYEAVNEYGKSVFTKTVVVKDTTKPIIKVDYPLITLKYSEIEDYMSNRYLSDITITDNSNLETTINISTDVTKIEGEYYIKYIVSDKSGNSATYTRKVLVVESISIVFDSKTCKTKLSSASEVDELNNILGTCASGNGEITYEGTVGKLSGTYNIIYTLVDSFGHTDTLTQPIRVEIVPEIAFKGGTCSTTLTSVTAVNNMNNKLNTCVTGSGTVSYTGTINKKSGNYVIEYKVTDEYGNTNILPITFNVNIIPSIAFDDTKCTTTLTSEYTVNNMNNNLNTCITGSGTVTHTGSIGKASGNYDIVYTLTDSYGNTNTLSKTFNVNIVPSMIFDTDICTTILINETEIKNMNNNLNACITGSGTVTHTGSIGSTNGEYNIAYTLTDSYGNKNTLTQKFKVQDTVLGNYGDIVYYDAVNNTLGCTTYQSSNSTSGVVDGCLKWNILSGNNDRTVNLILDHNIVSGVAWHSDTYYVTGGPTEAVAALNNATKDKWNSALIRSDSFSQSVKSDMDLKTYTFTVDYTGMKARLPEGYEIAIASGYDSFKYSSQTYYFDSKNITRTVGYDKDIKTSSYSWLFNNLNKGSSATDASDTNTCLYYGCIQNLGKTSGDYGYWTSTAKDNSTATYIWHVVYDGELDWGQNPNYTNLGIRPVITLDPNI